MGAEVYVVSGVTLINSFTINFYETFLFLLLGVLYPPRGAVLLVLNFNYPLIHVVFISNSAVLLPVVQIFD